MATETDAARDRVLAARGALAEELETLEASARAAADIPAKIKRSPAKAAAIAGSAAFLVVGGPKRLYRAGRRAVTGEPDPLPKAMLPKEIEKTLKKLGDDGEKVRGTLERDFANYTKQAAKDRSAVTTKLVTSATRPVLAAGAAAAAKWLFRNDNEDFQARLAQVRERVRRQEASERGEESVAGSERRDRPHDDAMARAEVMARAEADEEAGSAGA